MIFNFADFGCLEDFLGFSHFGSEVDTSPSVLDAPRKKINFEAGKQFRWGRRRRGGGGKIFGLGEILTFSAKIFVV